MKNRICEKKELELYFHIPFCIRKCYYCDFLSAPGDDETKRHYMKALLAETAGSASRYAEYCITSIFIGGGTPSVVPTEYMEELLEAVRSRYRLAEEAEITMEVNPGTVRREALLRLRKAGVNRLSIGLQSAHNEELAVIGRIHTWEQFEESFAAAREAGFDNINVDLMSGLPGQTLFFYTDSLRKVLSLSRPPEHISAYSLIVEEGTPFYKKWKGGELDIPDEDTDRLMYQETKTILAREGYRRYEISNYAKEGYECRHNCGYWKRKNYIGFGIGAASLLENVRFRNSLQLNGYLANPLGCREEIQPLSTQEQMEEFFFLGLRMTEGIDCREFEKLFGCRAEEVYGDVIRKNIRDGLLRYHGQAEQVEGRTSEDRMQGDGLDSNKREITDGDKDSGELLYGDRSRREENEKAVRERKNRDRNGADCALYLALTDRGLDVSNYVMAQFLL
ncbi:MAG: radical SAM family heme chaperone HemW [Lachnospiraceae bacterium]|nr:radical SAM family heme chaperone HemW [uncultured Acetatifactor sp.]MCI8287529.1 radical SAM family heme chaperone HemW [Lachnospiraceae bacterium]